MILRILILSLVLFTSCKKTQGQSANEKIVGGPCEGCEAVYEYGNKTLTPSDTISSFYTMKEKIKVYGTGYKADGVTPANDVILYFYHTDDNGKYPTKSTSKGWERNHGFLRGWVKTGSDGSYEIYTARPASYPNSTVPQHIHVTVKEPDKNEYYIEDFYFDDDPNLPESFKKRKNPRGGSGFIKLVGNEIKTAKRNIILGLNIPNYN